MQVNEERSEQFGAGMGVPTSENSRRAQIIAATIATVADIGYAKTSFARIVERAELSSTRLISYHFAGKADLLQATLLDIIDTMDTYLGSRTPSDADRPELLRAYIESEVAFLHAYPERTRALIEIGTNARKNLDTPVVSMVWHDLRVGRLERQLQQGQREGAFGSFDVAVMAMTIRQALDGVSARFAEDPELDVEAYGRELAELFDRATRPAQD
ncbi:transcriptional regulator, TetR family [Amycolatopsis marina]|uniref:Transcriptional regulator, TetR family n=1 Tax=Amycolatopsis marina TaxID=490629 RepID=A0A1I1CBF9_9PSEU|nr:TetR family transcriptional regulator [Amycolatopsis marina]SFB57733.1 transcriptional regulator, TetR family [Amycolatopsis marina]